MKGTIVLKPLEFSIEAFGEKWHQGDKIKGVIKIKNHGLENKDLFTLKAGLCEGHYKKIKAKDAKGWKILESFVLVEQVTLNQGEEKDLPFEIKLTENCTITDKNGSLYLALFNGEDSLPFMDIELVVEPKLIIKEILKIFENFLRFKVKEVKSGKNALEIKLVPPNSREMTSVDGLTLNISEVEKNLTLQYLFALRGLDLTSATIQVEKKTREIQQIFNSKQYLIYGDSINQDFIITSVQEILDTVATKRL